MSHTNYFASTTGSASINSSGKLDIFAQLLLPPGEIDEIDLDQLTQLVLAVELSEPEGATRDSFCRVINNLDSVYAVKVFRYLSTPSDRVALGQLADHLSRVSSDIVINRLDAFEKRYGSRWRAFLDLIQVALRVEVTEQKSLAAEKQFGEVPQSWKWIANQVSKAGSEGLEWSALLGLIQMGDGGEIVKIRTKSGLSMLVTSMRHGGWLRVVAQGRTRKLFLGNRVSLTDATGADLEQISRPKSGRDYSRILNEVIKSGTCYNQGAFLDFLLLASERHKSLKESLPKDVHAPPQKRSRQELSALCVYLHGQTQRAAENNFRFMERYFELSERQTSVLPRISVKLVDRINEKEFVLDLARNHARATSSTQAMIDSNTGFDEIRRSGKYLLINDIAREVFSQRYKNPRLRSERVSEFLGSASLRSSGSITPAQWRGLWIGAEEEDNHRSAYRSTLIVPITLVNNAVSVEFRDVVRKHTVPNESSQAIDRTIMGFLCFDHVDANYFNESSDVDIGYVFADWLSLFLFVRYMYTSMSTSFSRCSAEFSRVDFVDALRREIVVRRRDEGNSDAFYSNGVPMSSRHNDVFPTDAVQRVCAGM